MHINNNDLKKCIERLFYYLGKRLDTKIYRGKGRTNSPLKIFLFSYSDKLTGSYFDRSNKES